jgi:pyruvate dehydrogenase complex dihydrolipoamide acetyltransferase long form
MAIRVTLPEMGEGVIEGTLARWLVKEGERIEQFAPIAEVETDKVTTETTSETAGTILKLCVREGETVPVGTVLAYVGEPGESISENGNNEAGENNQPAPSETTGDNQPKQSGIDSSITTVDRQSSTPSTRSIEATDSYTGRISPVVGRIAAEHDVDLGRVTGTGRDGRITKEDVLAYVETMTDGRQPSTTAEPSLKPAPTATTTEGTHELLPLTGIRRSIAEHMVRSVQTSPHVTTVFEFDFSAAAAHRRANKDSYARDGVRLTFTAYIVAATIKALKVHPMVNSSWSDEGILLKREINIGMATAIDDGLIVPVIKNADEKNVLGLSRAIADVAERARAKQLKPEEVHGGTFTITNPGQSGAQFAMPIINQPQVAILGVGTVEKRPVVVDEGIAIRTMVYLTLGFDHRLIDGAVADQFMAGIKQHLEHFDPNQL